MWPVIWHHRRLNAMTSEDRIQVENHAGRMYMCNQTLLYRHLSSSSQQQPMLPSWSRTYLFRQSPRYYLIYHRQPNKAVRQSPDLLFIATSFWFEESPSAVRTNKAGLGRLCTLFVCSTLLVFEHTHAVLSSTLVLCCTMVTTSTAAMSNSRYADTDRMKNVFWSDFRKRTWIEPKPDECLQTGRLYHCIYQ